MTPQRAKELLPVITAFANGETVECSATQWATREVLINASFDYPEMEYRIKPKPVMRSWQSIDDIPGPICWIRYRDAKGFGVLVLAATPDGVSGCWKKDGMPYVKEWDELADREWSTDLKQWYPCTVTEEP